ncbi:hypothetical protein DFQ27_002677 [Actinomortierella ambigua]|uniref:Uncharacterized protein n=1 Tax=Actinomortierella ambigua TaxID=1343610 RepID=A0A9P6U752_9FUNG|nr:hypothetical protein DFQ27_002677 [Actinomortierella ambigua]
MSKRYSSPPAGETPRPQKLQRLDEGGSPATAMPPLPSPPQSAQPAVSSPSAPGSRTPSDSSRSSTSESSSSRGNEVPGRFLTMKSLFKRNFDGFGGSSWVLPSGAIVDDRLCEVVEALPHESALHSFVVEDVDALLALFDDVKDKEEITRIMMTRQVKLPDLSQVELNFIKLYEKSPEDLNVFLRTHSSESVSNLLEDKPSEEFQEVAHQCITQVFWHYQRYGFAFPREQSEAWFNRHLWGFLPFALTAHPFAPTALPLFDYRPGEISSESSARRRRKQADWDGRQQVDPKVDGVVVVGALPVEICWMEAARRDGGLNTTKCLHDTLKLIKLMKDGHDMFREMARQDIRYKLATYGIRISGPSISIITLRQRPGRFYQAFEEETNSLSLPSTWYNKGSTTWVLAVIVQILQLRKALQAIASSADAWVQPTINSETSSIKDWIAPTMTSPQLLPVTLAGSAMTAPPLNI